MAADGAGSEEDSTGGVKRAAPDGLLPEREAKIPRLEKPDIEGLRQTAELLRQRPFGLGLSDSEWELKRRCYGLLGDVFAAAGVGREGQLAGADMVYQLVRSGYAPSPRDRRELVIAGAWVPAVQLFLEELGASERSSEDQNGSSSGPSPRVVSTVHLFMFLGEHVSFYEDFAGLHANFWHPNHFKPILKRLPQVVAEVPDTIRPDQWDSVCLDLENAVKTLGRFMVFWTSSGGKEDSSFLIDIIEFLPLVMRVVEVFDKFDNRFSKEASAKGRGDLLEELVRLTGLLAQYVLSLFEDPDTRTDHGNCSSPAVQAAALLNLLIRILMLKVPTFGPKVDAQQPGNNLIPLDERQLETDWIEGLWEHCQYSADDVVHPSVLTTLFQVMTGMQLEEQKYRLECVAPLIPTFISKYAEQLKQKDIPVELTDLKVVLNAVLQDDGFVNSEFMEEVSFYPCLLEFATKRATIHAVCERVKLLMSSGDPIRLVVPRDNVLDGVCDTLNLQDPSARVEVPLEIEFRAGYADSSGRELVDEGEDQGGLRRQWLDRASRHFISSDLFMSPCEAYWNAGSSEEAGPSRPSAPLLRRTASQVRGKFFVPSPESVCRCVQDNWEEQFEVFGCILGFALLHKETIPVHFGHNFLRSVFGLKTDAQDLLPLLESVDRILHTKVKYILDGDYLALGDTLADALEQSRLPLVFSVDESRCPGLTASTMLKENGDKIPVTEENKEEFVMLLLDRILISGLAHQVQCFRRGLLRVVPEEIVQRIAELMTVKEIEVMVCGADDIDVEDWEKYTQYENGYTKESPPVGWFWDTVRAMTQPARAALLSFATGSSQVPSGGFRFLQPELFTVQRVACSDRYPEAHTCANTIDLPEYGSREELERRLRFAVSEAGDAFGRR